MAPAVEGGGRRRATVIALLEDGASGSTVLEGAREAVIPDGSLWLLA